MNKSFLEIKKIPNLKIFDFSQSIMDLEFYRDQNHLNDLRKVEFIKLLKIELNYIKVKFIIGK